MFKKCLFLVVLALVIISCQFTETLVMNEDGSGKMSVSMDLSEMMAFGGMTDDTTTFKMDTLVSMKEFLAEKKDSISQLPAAEQQKLKKMESFNIRMFADSDTNEMVMDVFTNFKSIEEANDIMNGLEQTSNFMSGVGDVKVEKDESSSDAMGVNYSYENGVFKRDAYIKNVEKHKQQIDSIGQAESFMSSAKYRLKYTFPRKIKKTSNNEATFSLDGKTVEVEASFIAYMKDPDVLDLEVELEN